MNIQLLLSANPSQGSGASGTQATGPQSVSNGLFRQAMLQANEGQTRLPKELPSGSMSTAREPAALDEFASLLESLGIELDQEGLAALLAQLQTAEQPSPEQLAALPGLLDGTAETSPSALDEIANRLSLVAAFSDSAVERRTAATDDTITIADIAEQLAIGQEDAAALVAAFQQLTASTGAAGSHQRVESLNQQIASLLHQPAPANTPAHGQPSASTTLATASPQAATPSLTVSSDAMASALAVSSSAGEAAARLGSANEMAFHLPNPGSAAQPAALAGASQSAALSTPVSHPAWPSQLGQQLVQFAQRGGEQQIQLNLHPAELGPLSISLKMTEQGAQAHFLSAHAQVRQVVEQAIPQLRDALAEQGISLGETSVGEQNASNEQAFAQQRSGGTPSGDGSGVEGDTSSVTTDGTPVALDGRVDLYA